MMSSGKRIHVNGMPLTLKHMMELPVARDQVSGFLYSLDHAETWTLVHDYSDMFLALGHSYTTRALWFHTLTMLNTRGAGHCWGASLLYDRTNDVFGRYEPFHGPERASKQRFPDDINYHGDEPLFFAVPVTEIPTFIQLYMNGNLTTVEKNDRLEGMMVNFHTFLSKIGVRCTTYGFMPCEDADHVPYNEIGLFHYSLDITNRDLFERTVLPLEYDNVNRNMCGVDDEFLGYNAIQDMHHLSHALRDYTLVKPLSIFSISPLRQAACAMMFDPNFLACLHFTVVPLTPTTLRVCTAHGPRVSSRDERIKQFSFEAYLRNRDQQHRGLPEDDIRQIFDETWERVAETTPSDDFFTVRMVFNMNTSPTQTMLHLMHQTCLEHLGRDVSSWHLRFNEKQFKAYFHVCMDIEEHAVCTARPDPMDALYAYDPRTNGTMFVPSSIVQQSLPSTLTRNKLVKVNLSRPIYYMQIIGMLVPDLVHASFLPGYPCHYLTNVRTPGCKDFFFVTVDKVSTLSNAHGRFVRPKFRDVNQLNLTRFCHGQHGSTEFDIDGPVTIMRPRRQHGFNLFFMRGDLVPFRTGLHPVVEARMARAFTEMSIAVRDYHKSYFTLYNSEF